MPKILLSGDVYFLYKTYCLVLTMVLTAIVDRGLNCGNIRILAFLLHFLLKESSLFQLFYYPEMKVKVLVAQSCLTLCDPLDCSPPGFSVHGILQTKILEWVAIPFSRGSSRPRDQTQVSHIVGRFFTFWPTREALRWYCNKKSRNLYGEGNDNPLQYSCLENSVDGGAWWDAVHGVAQVRHDWSDLACMHALEKEMATHSSILAWRIPGTEDLVGCRLWGRTELDITEAT